MCRSFVRILGFFWAILSFCVLPQAESTVVDLQPVRFTCTAPVAGVQGGCTLTVKNVGQAPMMTMLGLELAQIEIPALATDAALNKTACSATSGGLVFGQLGSSPINLLHPNVEAQYPINVTFPQAGQLDLQITLSLRPSSTFTENNTSNNVLTTSVNVGLPKPVICSVEPVSGNVYQVKINGLWFKKLGASDSIKVVFGRSDTQATVLSTPSATPSTVTVASKDLGCLSPEQFKVSNASATSDPFQVSFPTPVIKSVSTDPRFSKPFTVQGSFRDGCPATVILKPDSSTLAPIRLDAIAKANALIVTLPDGRSQTGYALSVETAYGNAAFGKVTVNP
jgi:hypothetical protein